MATSRHTNLAGGRVQRPLQPAVHRLVHERGAALRVVGRVVGHHDGHGHALRRHLVPQLAQQREQRLLVGAAGVTARRRGLELVRQQGHDAPGARLRATVVRAVVQEQKRGLQEPHGTADHRTVRRIECVNVHQRLPRRVCFHGPHGVADVNHGAIKGPPQLQADLLDPVHGVGHRRWICLIKQDGFQTLAGLKDKRPLLRLGTYPGQHVDAQVGQLQRRETCRPRCSVCHQDTA